MQPGRRLRIKWPSGNGLDGLARRWDAADGGTVVTQADAGAGCPSPAQRGTLCVATITFALVFGLVFDWFGCLLLATTPGGSVAGRGEG